MGQAPNGIRWIGRHKELTLTAERTRAVDPIVSTACPKALVAWTAVASGTDRHGWPYDQFATALTDLSYRRTLFILAFGSLKWRHI